MTEFFILGEMALLPGFRVVFNVEKTLAANGLWLGQNNHPGSAVVRRPRTTGST